MLKKKRLLALCVSILTIPAFTMGDVPYRLPVGEAHAITASERTSMIDVAVTYKGYKALKQENAESETTCGTEAETETTTCKVTEAATEAPTTAQAEDPTEGPKQEVVEVAEVAKPAEKPRVEIPTEAETILEETETAETLMTENESEETEVETILETEEETEESTEAATGADEFVWDGPKLTKSSGIVPADQTPSGYKETWYPWDLHGCLDLLGYSYDGYQKDCPDGVQRYNGYICVASPDLNAHPKGSLIPTTLGMGIVLDFCPAGNLDIAVTW